MTFLSAADLAGMRADVNMMLPDSCIIQSFTSAPDENGAPVKTWAAVGTVNCRLDPAVQAQDAIELNLERETLTNYRRLTLPYNTTILPGYRVTMGAAIYEILVLDHDHSWNVSKRAVIAEVK